MKAVLSSESEVINSFKIQNYELKTPLRLTQPS
jgi:hypothetical protein